MPLNSYRCKECGKYNNYVVALDEDGEQEVVCSVCGNTTNIGYRDLPERVRESMEMLDVDSRIFEDETGIVELEPKDTVEDTLAAVDKKFEAAKQEMSSFDKVIGISGNIMDIANEYISEDGVSVINGFTDAVIGSSGELSPDWKQKGFSAFLNEAGSCIENDHSTSARIVSYMQQVLRSGRGIAAITDEELMQQAGLTKKEKFLVRQAVKSDQITEILKQVL